MDVTGVLTLLVEGAVLAASVATAVVALVRARGAGWSGAWVAGAFVALALALGAVWGPGLAGWEDPSWVGDTGLILLLAVPFLLLMFTASLRDLPGWLRAGSFLFGFGATLLLAYVDTAWAVLVALVYWTATSSVTVVALWRAGRRQPTVARRRMRLMSLATAALAIALVVAVELGDAAEWVEIGVALLVLASSLTFGLGFAPPVALRLMWRRPEDAHLNAGVMAVMQATSTPAIADALLEPTARIVGGSGAALVDGDGRVMASYGEAPSAGEHVRVDEPDGDTRSRHVVPLSEGQGHLVAWTSPYTPFFGPEELGLLTTMAAFTSLSVERQQRLRVERERRNALARAQQEAELARQEADEANAAKSRFLSRMSHELRTPLNAILGFGQLLEGSQLSEEDQEGVGYIVKAGRHLLALINDVLDLSRIEAGELTVSPEPVHCGELIDDALALLRPSAAARRIELTGPATACDVYVMTDRQRGRQVLLNLLSNAVKYNHDGGSVVVTCTLLPDAMLRVAVRDTGPGIDPARRELLFAPFERLGAETSGIEGTGLGLALSRQLIEQLGGAVGVESTPGRGSTFWIDLPVTDEPAAPAGAPPADVDRAADRDGRVLLLIEDNLANLRLVEAMLRQRPHVTVLPAMQGGLGLELAYNNTPDVIVLDLHLPDMSGREVLTRLKADPRTRDIPVLVATADVDRRRGQALVADGAFAYLTKPLDLQSFLGTVDDALEEAFEVSRGTATVPPDESLAPRAE
jgi:signal transduction histidine kinase/CheY-like chemotaxis protein